MRKRPTLYDYPDQCQELEGFSRAAIAALYSYFEMDGMGGIIYTPDDSEYIQTSRDNHKDTGYVAFHEGCIITPMYMTVDYADKYDRWPEKVRNQIDYVKQENGYATTRKTAKDMGCDNDLTDSDCEALLSQMETNAAKWERDGYNTLDRWEPYHRAWQWMQQWYDNETQVWADDDYLLMVKITCFYQEYDEDDHYIDSDSLYGRLHVRLSVNTDSPYYRERIAWLKENAQQEFDLWETSIEYTGTEVTNELTDRWAKAIEDTLWPKE